MPLRSVLVLFGLLALGAPFVRADERAEKALRALDIKFSRDSEGAIVAVELPSDSNDADFAALLGIATIVEIRAPECRASGRAIEVLGKLPHLTTLYCERAYDPNGIAYAIGKIKTLNRLSLARSPLTNHGLEDLWTAHPDLRELDVSQTRIDNNSWPTLAKFTQLEVLDISSCKLEAYRRTLPYAREAGPFAEFGNLPNLRRLSAFNIRLRAMDLYPLGNCCELEYLGVGPYVIDDGAHALIYLQETFPKLRLGAQIVRSLNSPKYRAVTSSTDGKGNVATLRCIYPTFMMIPLSQLSQLTELHIIGATELAFIDSLPELRHLTLELPPPTEKLVSLRRALNLEAVVIARGRIDAGFVRELLTIDTLKSISIEFCDLSEEAAQLLRARKGNKLISITPRSD